MDIERIYYIRYICYNHCAARLFNVTDDFDHL